MIAFDLVRLFDWFDNQTHTELNVRLCLIAEPN